MKAIQISRTGGPEVLELVDLPMPEPGPTDVRHDADRAPADDNGVATTKPLDLSSNGLADFEPSVPGIGRTGQR